MSSLDEAFMRRAIALAKTGRGVTEPNPAVGCVWVRGGEVIGEGRTKAPGGRHAEPTALADCRERGNDPRGATAYVTLEPCCHTNKRTPPCVPAVIGAGISRVVVGCLDPNPDVNGQGIAQLRAAGIEVVFGVLEAECKQLIAPFIAMTVHGRPYVTLKWAESADGFIAGAGGERRQISSPEATRVVHLLRARCDAILIGGQTLRNDDPSLTARAASANPPARRLLRAVVTRSADLPGAARLFNSPEAGEALTFAGQSFTEILADLASRGVAHLLVESGGRLASALLAENLVDRIWHIRSPMPLHVGTRGISVPADGWTTSAAATIGGDAVAEQLNMRSPVFFDAAPSTDAEQLLRP